jgi:hypothetical protein
LRQSGRPAETKRLALPLKKTIYGQRTKQALTLLSTSYAKMAFAAPFADNQLMDLMVASLVATRPIRTGSLDTGRCMADLPEFVQQHAIVTATAPGWD